MIITYPTKHELARLNPSLTRQLRHISSPPSPRRRINNLNNHTSRSEDSEDNEANMSNPLRAFLHSSRARLIAAHQSSSPISIVLGNESAGKFSAKGRQVLPHISINPP